MVAEERLSLEKSLWFANQSRVKSLCEAPLFPARGTSHKLVNKEKHEDQEEERAHDDELDVKEEKS